MLKEKQLGLTSTEFKEYLISLIGNSPYGIFAIDLLGYVTIANQLAVESLMVNCQTSDFVDKNIIDLTAHIPQLHGKFASVLYGKRENFDIKEIHISDKVLEVKGRKILNGTLVTIIDITEQVKNNNAIKSYANKLKAMNEDLEEFNYISAHDLKSPVSTIFGLVELLDEEKELSESASEIIRMLRCTINTTRKKIEALNRVMANKKDLHLDSEKCNLEESVNEVLNSLAHAIKESNAEICTKDLNKIVYFPPVHMGSILQNLIDNSIKYAKPETRPVVNISTHENDNYDVITISDNGIGIDMERYGDKIFNLFYRISDKKDNGTGVGLHIVKNIVTSYNGYLEVKSEPGAGTTIKIFLEKYNEIS